MKPSEWTVEVATQGSESAIVFNNDVRKLQCTFLGVLALLCTSWAVCDAVLHKQAAAAVEFGAAAALTLTCVVMWKCPNWVNQGVLTLVTLSSIVAIDAIHAGVYDMWALLVLPCAVPLSAGKDVVAIGAIAVATVWVILRTVGEVHTVGTAEMEKESWQVGWRSLTIRCYLTAVAPAVALLGRQTDTTADFHKAVLLAEEVAASLLHLDLEAAEHLVYRGHDIEGKGDPEAMQDALKALVGRVRQIQPYLPPSMLVKTQSFTTQNTRSAVSSDGGEDDDEVKAPEYDRRPKTTPDGLERYTAPAVPEPALFLKHASVLCAHLPVERYAAASLESAALTFAAAVVDVARGYEGTVYHMSGDTVLVTWNTGHPVPLHMMQACSCAVALKDLLRHQEVPWWGLAVCTGTVRCGMVGMPEQLSEAVIGLPVVSAAELSSLAVQLGVSICLTEQVYEHVRTSFYARPVDIAKTTDANTPLVIYDLLQLRAATDSSPPECNATFVEAFGAFQNQRHAECSEKLLNHLRTVPRDTQALRLLRLVLWRRVPPHRCMVGWEDLEGQAPSIPDDVLRSVKQSIKQPSTTDFFFSDFSISRRGDLSKAPRRQQLDQSGKHDKLLRRQILDAEAEANAAQLSAWGYMPSEKSATESSGGKGKLPAKVEDHLGIVWSLSTRCLGRGAFGEVWLAMGGDGGLVAVKTAKLPHCDECDTPPSNSIARRRAARKQIMGDGGERRERMEVLDNLLQEVALMQSLRHENIVSYLGSSVQSGHICIVMEYLSGGSLMSVLQDFKEGGLPDSCIKRYVGDIVRGLVFLHSHSIVHRDMKPHNILVLPDGRCKLADFGASAELAKIHNNDRGLIGTPLYMAPEACRKNACPASDIWGLGIIVCQLFTNSLPYVFTEECPFNPHVFIFRLSKGDVLPDIPHTLPADARTFVRSCLHPDPVQRPGARELQGYSFLLQ